MADIISLHLGGLLSMFFLSCLFEVQVCSKCVYLLMKILILHFLLLSTYEYIAWNNPRFVYQEPKIRRVPIFRPCRGVL